MKEKLACNSRKHKSKYVRGPGGIRCRCCRVGRIGEAKRGANRDYRRKVKQSLRDELDNKEEQR